MRLQSASKDKAAGAGAAAVAALSASGSFGGGMAAAAAAAAGSAAAGAAGWGSDPSTAAADIAAQQHMVGGLCMDFAQVRHDMPWAIELSTRSAAVRQHVHHLSACDSRCAPVLSAIRCHR
eukprot:GHRQ01039334.1.p1 GENE.GHRQ01039334.1~~GHRQ01039334.1.p1  ORF type:complete len:121 (+),score=39.13 GHRQ01039334.1:191-553(+)